MTKLRKRTPSRNTLRASQPDLFSWQSCPPHEPATRAGQHLCRRYRIKPVIADLIASLAGLDNAEARN